jgi:tripartite-type tricarboxylate transporter receptor subunit TctC
MPLRLDGGQTKAAQFYKRLSGVAGSAGAGGMPGTDLGAKSDPDGCTVLISSNGPFAVQLALGGKMPYDPQKDLLPIALLTKQPFVLMTHAAHPATDLKRRPESAVS